MSAFVEVAKLAKMLAFWNAMGARRWRAAHDVLNTVSGVEFAKVLPWRAKRES
jgi:hypothetical protein